eukprot:COSAG02_NODE_1174_length_14082_cov_1929.950154_14_plen_376_part_00
MVRAAFGWFVSRMVAADLTLTASATKVVQDLSVPIELRNASGLPRYVVGSFSIGGVTQHATFDAGNPTMPIFMSQSCRGCGSGCPKTVPLCDASAPFCTPSTPTEYAPMGSYQNLSSPCEKARPAGKLDGVTVCMGCFGGASHSRFYTMAKADVTINADQPMVLPGLVFGALVRTAPAIDRIWGNVGVGYGSTWLAQLGITAIRFHLRTAAASVTFNPSPASFTSLPSAPFEVTANREVTVALSVGSEECGGATFHIDTGNSGISIEDPHLAVALASAVGGRWDNYGNLVLTSDVPPGTRAHTNSSIVVMIGTIRAVIPASIWQVGTGGRTIFAKYHKNVLGLPFIMAGDMIFDDAHKRIYFGYGSSNNSRITEG